VAAAGGGANKAPGGGPPDAAKMYGNMKGMQGQRPDAAKGMPNAGNNPGGGDGGGGQQAYQPPTQGGQGGPPDSSKYGGPKGYGPPGQGGQGGPPDSSKYGPPKAYGPPGQGGQVGPPDSSKYGGPKGYGPPGQGGPPDAAKMYKPQAPAGNAGGNNLSGTTWVGSETLENYGRLEFRFSSDTQVTMIDAKETVPGTYMRNGNQITMTFFDGEVVYTGTVSGQTMSGTARNPGSTWSWTVKR